MTLAKSGLWVVAVAAMSFLLIAGSRPDLGGNLPRPNKATEKKGKPHDRVYSLPRAQGEALALLLRLDLPDDTSIVVRDHAPHSPGVEVAISAPKSVHDVVAPLVNLLMRERVERQKAENAELLRKMEQQRALRPDGSQPRVGQ